MEHMSIQLNKRLQLCSPKIKVIRKSRYWSIWSYWNGYSTNHPRDGSFSLTIASTSFNSIIHCNSAHSIDSWNGNDMNVVEKRKVQTKKIPHHDVREIFDSAIMKTCVKNWKTSNKWVVRKSKNKRLYHLKVVMMTKMQRFMVSLPFSLFSPIFKVIESILILSYYYGFQTSCDSCWDHSKMGIIYIYNFYFILFYFILLLKFPFSSDDGTGNVDISTRNQPKLPSSPNLLSYKWINVH
jgi:hypothetical protein